MILYYTGLSIISRKTVGRNGKYILMFHGISKSKRKDIPSYIQPHLDVDEFEHIIKWVKHRFSIIKPEDLLNPKSNGALFTFDDGFYNNYANVLPLLEKHEIPGLFFITNQHIKDSSHWLSFIQNKLNNANMDIENIPNITKKDYYNGISETQLKEMADNPWVTIGSSSETHADLTTCNDLELELEIIDSKKYLENISKKPMEFFAYPSGHYNEHVVKLVENAGYKAAFGIDRVQKLGLSKYEIPRIGIYESKNYYLSAKLSGLYQRPLK